MSGADRRALGHAGALPCQEILSLSPPEIEGGMETYRTYRTCRYLKDPVVACFRIFRACGSVAQDGEEWMVFSDSMKMGRRQPVPNRCTGRIIEFPTEIS